MLANTSRGVVPKTAGPIRGVMWRLRIPRPALALAARIRNRLEIQVDPGEGDGDSIQTVWCRAPKDVRSPTSASFITWLSALGPKASTPGPRSQRALDACPLSVKRALPAPRLPSLRSFGAAAVANPAPLAARRADRKSTRLNSSHLGISYAV